MKLLVSHMSAINYWKTHNPCDYKHARISGISDCAWSAKDLSRFNLYQFNTEDAPLDLLVGSDAKHHGAQWINCHRTTETLPLHSFIDIGNNIFVAAPAYAFAQVAKTMQFHSALLLGMELCGRYWRADGSASGFVEHAPVATTKELRTMATRHTCAQSRSTAVQAARYVLDNSASPMESAIALLLSLPVRRGGYGLPQPVMNMRINYDKAKMPLVLREYVKCDLCWPDKQVVIEYDSDMFHANANALDKDASKRNLLVGMGYTVVTLTRGQVVDPLRFERVAVDLGKLMGKRSKGTSYDSLARRTRLQHQLFGRNDKAAPVGT